MVPVCECASRALLAECQLLLRAPRELSLKRFNNSNSRSAQVMAVRRPSGPGVERALADGPRPGGTTAT